MSDEHDWEKTAVGPFLTAEERKQRVSEVRFVVLLLSVVCAVLVLGYFFVSTILHGP